MLAAALPSAGIHRRRQRHPNVQMP